MKYIRSIQIAISGDCNYSCVMCGQPRDSGKFMARETWGTLVDSLKRWPIKVEVAMAVRGEPLIHPLFPEFLRMLRDANAEKPFLYQVYLDTNGSCLKEANVAALLDFVEATKGIGFRLTLSLDAASPKKYRQIRRGGNLNDVRENIKSFLRERVRRGLKQPALNFQFIAMEQNEAEVGPFLNYWKEVLESFGLDYTVSGRYPTSDKDNISFVDLHVQNGKVTPARAKELHEHACKLAGVKAAEPVNIVEAAPNKGRFPCAWPWYMVVVNWDGKVAPCCRDILSKNVMGDLAFEPLDKIVGGEKYREFRLAQISGRAGELEVCKDCFDQLIREKTTLDTINEYLESIGESGRAATDVKALAAKSVSLGMGGDHLLSRSSRSGEKGLGLDCPDNQPDAAEDPCGKQFTLEDYIADRGVPRDAPPAAPPAASQDAGSNPVLAVSAPLQATPPVTIADSPVAAVSEPVFESVPESVPAPVPEPVPAPAGAPAGADSKPVPVLEAAPPKMRNRYLYDDSIKVEIVKRKGEIDVTLL
jgi:molybdenum cofactor biosynthesis enzyme MoaA